jgi:hypothetical protein
MRPPPRFRAIADTSISSCEARNETRFGEPGGSGGSRIIAAISVPSTARRRSMIPSAYSSPTPKSSKSLRSRYEMINRPPS